ncbi:MAG: amidohydrolase family protein [Candidatus Promineifilaceae bacterium]
MIIDFHTHLGDVLQQDGGSIIRHGRVRKPIIFDPLLLFESRQWRATRGARLLAQQCIKAGMARSATATLANIQQAMQQCAVDFCVTLPVFPNVTFNDLKSAARQDPRMLPFTSVDFSSIDTVEQKLSADVSEGAHGLKLHPILQKVPLNHPDTYAAVEAFAVHNRPILFHSGVSEYYTEQTDKHRAAPEYGNIEGAVELVTNFPGVNFVVGHAGMDSVDQTMQQMGHLHNVWVEISFQSPERVRELVSVFGPERVLYGSDWPWGNMWATMNVVSTVTRHDPALAYRILYANAQDLLDVSLLPKANKQAQLSTLAASENVVM